MPHALAHRLVLGILRAPARRINGEAVPAHDERAASLALGYAPECVRAVRVLTSNAPAVGKPDGALGELDEEFGGGDSTR